MRLIFSEHRNRHFAIKVKVTDERLEYWFVETIAKNNEEPEADRVAIATSGLSVVSETANYYILNSESEHRVIEFSTIKNMPDFSDHASFQLYDKKSINSENISPYQQPFNLFAATSASKMSGPAFAGNVSLVHPIGSILVPFKNSPVSDWIIGFNVESMEVVLDVQGATPEPYMGLDVARNLLLPKVWFDQKSATVASDGFADLSFYIGNADGEKISGAEAEVYLETTGGRLALQRVQTVGGVGTARIIADHLGAGSKFKVKCGFKYFSGTDDCEMTVV